MALLKMMGVLASKVLEASQTTFLLEEGNLLAARPPPVELPQNRRLETALDHQSREVAVHLRPQDDPGGALYRKEVDFMQSKTSRSSLIVT
jgi:hypothetical protein